MIRIATHPAAVPAAISTADALALLGAGASESSRVAAIVQNATRVAEDIARRWLWYRSYVEITEGAAHDRLYLQVSPLAAVSACNLLDSDTEIEDGSDLGEFEIFADTGILRMRGGWWLERARYQVAYTGGWWLQSMGVTPAAGAQSLAVTGRHILRAVEEIVELTYQSDSADRTVSSERIGGRASLAITYRDNLAIPQTALDTLRALAPLVP